MVVWILGIAAAALVTVATLVYVAMMLADTTNMSQTGHDGTTAAATAAEGGGGAELQPLQPKSGPAAKSSTKSTRSKSQSLMKKKAPAAPVVDEAKQQALEELQRSQLPEKLRDQCGYESDYYDGSGAWAENPPMQRIKVSAASPDVKARLLGHVAKCFERETILGVRIPFEPADVAEVLRQVLRYLQSEPMLIEDVPFGITVVGDLHGQLYDLHRIFLHDEKDGKPAWECMKYLFLGDYVDRGRQSLEILMVLFSLKIVYPDRIFLLRGNHEFLRTNLTYGFAREIFDRYDADTAEDLYMWFNGIFAYLSVAAIVQDKYFCAHGGVSPHSFTRSNLRAKEKPYYFSHDDQLINDICWADPAEGLRGTVFNGDRGSALFFGLDVLVHALYTIGAEILVRGHSNLTAGYAILGNGLCISLFSCTASMGGDNDGSVMYIDDEGYFKVMLLKKSAARVRWEQKLVKIDRGGEPEEEEDKNAKTVDAEGPGTMKKFGPTPTTN